MRVGLAFEERFDNELKGCDLDHSARVESQGIIWA